MIGETIGLLGSVKGRFGFSERLQMVLLVLDERLSLPLKNKNSAFG